MKETINTAYELQQKFKECNKDYYSLEGYETILNFYDEIDENIELDVIDICLTFTEYGNDVSYDFDDFISDYKIYYPQEEYMKNYDIYPDNFDKDDYINEIEKKIEDRTTLFDLSNGNILIMAF